ncbi:MAG: hypothetical protein U0640_13525 [Phycisphaerales bacterium]
MAITILAQSCASVQPSMWDWLWLPFLISLVASVLTVVGVWVKDLVIMRCASRAFLGRWDQFVPDQSKLATRPVPLVRDLGDCVITISPKSSGVVHLRAVHKVSGHTDEHVWEGDAVVNRQQHNRALVAWEYTKSSVGPDAGVYDLFLHDNGTLFMYPAVPPLPGDHPKFVLRRVR